MTRVLLIDDDVELLDMLKEYLEQEGYHVGVAHDGVAGAAAALSGAYAIAVLDIMMPRLNGLETLKQIRKKSQLPILMLTARGDDSDRVVGLELGADDYVPKPCTPRELTARIRAILRRTGPRVDPDNEVVLTVNALTMWPQQRRAEWDGQPLALTSTEFNLLEVLVRNTGRPVSKSDLSQQGLGRSFNSLDRNIDVHLSSLRHKLGVLSDGRSCIQTVYRLGYQYVKE